MDAYIYRAALYCEDCAARKRNEIDCAEALGPKPAVRRNRYLSSDYPQGPYAHGGGEADTPQHCDACGVFLENPLTDDGREYVELAYWVQEHYGDRAGDHALTDTWRAFYGEAIAR